MYTTFSIKELSSWAVIEFSCGEKKYEFWASYVYKDSFADFVDALLHLRNGTNSSAIVKFDLEAQGTLHLLLTVYPEQLTKLELYEGIDWEIYDDMWDDQKMPTPVFESILPFPDFLETQVVEQFEKYGKEGFSAWNNHFFDDKIHELKRKQQ